jgi:DOPA 4,5-dioxygenase
MANSTAATANHINGDVDLDLDRALDEEIKEFHFHVYFYQNNAESVKEAVALHNKIQALVKSGFFHPVPGKIYHEPFMPHLIGSYEVWCAREHFARTYAWFLLNRGNLSVLVHPLTLEEIKDHSDRAVWMGSPFPLDFSFLVEKLPKPDWAQYPELKLGYSADGENNLKY